MKFWIMALLLFGVPTWAEDEISLVDVIKSPIAKVGGSVNVISGSWVDNDSHITPSGADGIPLAHSYVSSSIQEGALGDGWDLFFPSELVIVQKKGLSSAIRPKGPLCNQGAALDLLAPDNDSLGIFELVPKSWFFPSKKEREKKRKENEERALEKERERHSNSITIYYKEAGGATVVFKGDYNAKHFEPKLHDSGYHHVNCIENPTRRNIHRTRIYQKSKDEWQVVLGDGTVRYYEPKGRVHRRQPKPKEDEYFKASFHITKEVLPSGNRRYYSYNSDADLKKIETKSSVGKSIHSFSFRWGNRDVVVKSSDGIETKFEIVKLHGQHNPCVVNGIKRVGKKGVAYSYSERTSAHIRRVREKRGSNGSYEEIKYYRPGTVEVGTHSVRVEGDNKKFLTNRVREVWTKTLPGDTKKLLNSFTYHTEKSACYARTKDSDGCRSLCFWNKKNHHPLAFHRKDSKGNLLSKEHYLWSKDRLVAKTIFDEKGIPQLSREFDFDDHGNVTREIYRGTFLGTPCSPLTLDNQKRPHGGDHITFRAEYDDRSLKKSEQDPLGNWTHYQYDPKRALLTGRLTCDGTQPIQREFYEYDKAAICVCEIFDDGISKDKDNFTYVTRRYTHKTRVREKTPFYGTPEEESWYIWTPKGGERLVKKLRYIRDRKGRPVEKQLIDSDGIVQKVWKFTYDALHRVIKQVDPTGAITEIIYNKEGLIGVKKTPFWSLYYTYDFFDRILEEKTVYPDTSSASVTYSYDLTGRQKVTTDSRGRVTRGSTDPLSRPTETVLPSLSTENGIETPIIRYSYEGRTQTQVSPTGAKTKTTYAASGKPLEIVSPTGAVCRYYYDKKNRLVKEIDPAGIVTLHEYDALDRLIKKVQLDGDTVLSTLIKEYDGFDLVEEATDTQKICHFYDAFGRRVKETITDLITGKTAEKQFFYDALHRLIKSSNIDHGTSSLISYDRVDRVLEEKTIGSEGDLISIATKLYDHAGRVVEEGTGVANTIAYTKTAYGAQGLPSAITHPDGTKTLFSYDPMYRGPGGICYLRRTTTDPRGVVTEELLDANDSPTLVTTKDPYGKVIARKKTISSILGNPVRIEDQAIANKKVCSTVSTQLSYDSVGQLTSCTLGSGSKESAIWSYSYDDLGRKIREKKPSGITLSSSYDSRGRLSRFQSSDGTIDWAYTYNNQNLPIEVASSGRKTSRSYDGLGNLISETLENGHTMSYERTATGSLSCITYPDKTKAFYHYKDGRLSRIDRKQYSYKVDERDLSGVITKATLPAQSGKISYTVDLMGRRTKVSHGAFSEERTLFDPVGSCLERTINGRKETFSYDSLSQLINDDGRKAAYDSLHRRLEYCGKKASHNARHQVLTQDKRSFHYDTDGRRSSDSSFTYKYDACDRLIEVSQGGKRAEYSYDPFNRRMCATFVDVTGVTRESYLWQEEDEIGSISDKKTTLRLLGEGFGAEIGAAVAMEISGDLYVPIHDLSGNVRACLDLGGSTLQCLEYTAVGLDHTDADITPWTFASKREDPVTGFLYFGRRYYDPTTATWLTQDPLGYSAGPNLYAYVKNNPLSNFDLRGLWSIGGVFKAIGKAVLSIFARLNFSYDANGAHFSAGHDAQMNALEAASASRTTDPAQEEKNIVETEISRDEDGNCVSAFHYVEKGEEARPYYEKYEGEKIEVCNHFNGICTDRGEAEARAKEALDAGACSVSVMSYSATKGAIFDGGKAAVGCFGLSTHAQKTLTRGNEAFLEKCTECGITPIMRIAAHSRGAEVASGMLNSLAFARSGRHEKRVKEFITLGGAVTSMRATNFIAFGDFVPLLNPINWMKFLFADVQCVMPRSIGEFFTAHLYQGGCYSRVMDEWYRSIREEGGIA